MSVLKLIAGLSVGRLLIFAVLTTIAYYFTYHDDGAVLQQQLSAVSEQVNSEASRRKGIEVIMKKEEEMRGNLLQLQRNLEVVKSKLPNEFKDTQMSTILNIASGASGVDLLELSTVSTDAAPIKVIEVNALVPENLVEEVKFLVTLTGTYEEFLRFLDVLTKEDKVLKVRNFIIEKNTTDIDDNLIKFKGEVIGYKQAVLMVANSTDVTNVDPLANPPANPEQVVQ